MSGRAGALVTVALSGVLWFASCPPSEARVEGGATVLPQQSYDIPAQPLDDALIRFAQVSHVDIIYKHALAEGRRSFPISGALTPQLALARLLNGTGLEVRFTKPNAALIFVPSAPPESLSRSDDGESVLMLDVMPVRAPLHVGGSSTGEFEAYSHRVLSELDRTLRPDALKDKRAYSAVLRVWVSQDGEVRRAEFIQGSGDHEADARMIGKITGLRLDEAPPVDLPQPLRFRLEAR